MRRMLVQNSVERRGGIVRPLPRFLRKIFHSKGLGVDLCLQSLILKGGALHRDSGEFWALDGCEGFCGEVNIGIVLVCGFLPDGTSDGEVRKIVV